MAEQLSFFKRFLSFFKDLAEKRNLRLLQEEINRILFQPVNNIMTRKVITVDVNDSLWQAAATMRREPLSCVVVTRANRIAGILTERDFVQKLQLVDQALQEKVSNLMSPAPKCAEPSTRIFDAHRFMVNQQFRKLPILEDGNLVGIITLTDIVKALDRFATHSIIDSLNTVHMWKIMASDLLTIEQTESVLEAQLLMASRNVSCILAKNEGHITGILTERDFVNEIAKDVSRLARFNVQDVMKSPVVSIPTHLQLFEANHFMLERNFRRFLVSEADKPVGIVTQTDIARSMLDFLDSLLDRIQSKKFDGLRVEKVSSE
ncbi:MAG: CBS domain-containing protein [Candidatus Woesearchaeota archaeon]